jgi:hypothetical protein
MKHTRFQILAGFVFVFASCDQVRCANVAKDGDGGAVVLARAHFIRAVGTIITTESADAGIGKVKAGEQEIEGAMSLTETEKETWETLSADKIRHLLVSKTKIKTMKMNFNGQDQNPPEEGDPMAGVPMAGVPVILERKDGKWTASLESGDQPTAGQQAALDKEVAAAEEDFGFQIYGDLPRKPGDKWDVDPAKLTNFDLVDILHEKLEGKEGKVQVEFVEVKELAGVRCAVLKSTYDIKMKTKSKGDSPAWDIQLKGEAVSQRSIADMIDLDVVRKATITATRAGSPTQITMPIKCTKKASLKKP